MFNKTILMSATAILMATTALAQSSRDDIIQELTDEGYTRIEITRTLFGNTKFEASGPTAEREIVLGKDGTILRDRTEIEDDDGEDGEDDPEDDLEDEEEDDDDE